MFPFNSIDLLSIYFCTEQDNSQLTMYFRNTFPPATYPPKLHMLEDHVVEFAKKWRFPLGFFGEQGGESFHHEFVDLANTFARLHPGSERLKRMLEEHFVVVHPQNREIIPHNNSET